jgi:hypothetical protein
VYLWTKVASLVPTTKSITGSFDNPGLESNTKLGDLPLQEPLSALAAEYERGNDVFIAKIQVRQQANLSSMLLNALRLACMGCTVK